MRKRLPSSATLSKTRAFTLVEMVLVIAISGMIMSVALQAYSNYILNKRLQDTRDSMDNVSSGIVSYSSTNKRYPCPADPSLDISDPLAGVSNCVLTLPVGSCSGGGTTGICRVAGARDTEADADNNPDDVLIGAVPFKTINDQVTQMVVGGGSGVGTAKGSLGQNISVAKTIDAWGRKMTYAVTSNLTKSPFNPAYGTIAVRKEDGGTLVQPANGAHYAIISHGPNGVGAYVPTGAQPIACAAATSDGENCDLDGVLLNGLYSESAGANYFDDILVYHTYIISSLWDYSQVSGFENYVHNLNPGNVGVGVSSPQQKLDVSGTVSALDVQAQNICDQAGANCFSPSLIGGAGMGCVSLAGDPPKTIRLATGIALNKVICSNPIPIPVITPGQTCTPDGFGNPRYMTGVQLDGTIVCQVPAP